LRQGNLPPAHRFDLDHLATLFELSLGLSAWKSYGANKWALRCNPSSGNLHPTEGYLLCPRLPGLSAGVYHYLSRDHVLEQRAAVDDPQWTAAFSGQGVLIGISSIYWREAWKYGMRAWRYCQHDCGHAIAALSYAAAALGWQTRLVLSTADDVVANLLGLDRSEDFEPAEREAPDALLWVGEPSARPDLEHLLDPLSKASWYGHANRLSQENMRWPDIDSIHRVTHKSLTLERSAPAAVALPLPAPPALDLTFAEITRQRRLRDDQPLVRKQLRQLTMRPNPLRADETGDAAEENASRHQQCRAPAGAPRRANQDRRLVRPGRACRSTSSSDTT